MNKILIIEEDINIASGLDSLLNLLGFEVRLASIFGRTEEEILNEIRFFNPDFIILEPGIKQVDGFTILYELKSDPETVHKSVFIFTDMNEGRDRAEKMGAEYYFHKKEHSVVGFINKFKKIITNILNK